MEYTGRNPYMDYRNTVPFMDLSGYVVNQPKFTEDMPAKSLQEHLLLKRLSTMINFRRLEYCARAREYRYGRK